MNNIQRWSQDYGAMFKQDYGAMFFKDEDGTWCYADDVEKLEALNAELLQFVEDFWEARQKGREDEHWLADAAWDLMEKADIAKAKADDPK